MTHHKDSIANCEICSKKKFFKTAKEFRQTQTAKSRDVKMSRLTRTLGDDYDPANDVEPESNYDYEYDSSWDAWSEVDPE
jgi:hypothetical protein